MVYADADDLRARQQAAAYLVGWRDGLTTNQPNEPGASRMTEPQALTREQILAADDTKAELVDVPEWGGGVWVQPLTGSAREAIEKSALGKNGKADVGRLVGRFRARIVASSVVDATGEQLFTEADLDGLSGKSAVALERVAEAAMRLSGMNRESVAEIEGE